MDTFLVTGMIAAAAAIAVCVWLCWQLLRQNGRILLRVEELEKLFDEDARSNGLRRHSLARTKIARNGLKAGLPAPEFKLPLVNGDGELSLPNLRGKRVLIVFSSPSCEPCNELAPQLEAFHHARPDFELVMISKGEPAENRRKVREHGLSFPVVLQQGWTTSRSYAIFATPAAYLLDQEGVTVHEVAVGIGPILQLLAGLD